MAVRDDARALLTRDEMVSHVHRTLALKHGSAPFYNFIGFNVTRDRILTAKVNHHHFHEHLDDTDISSFVPRRDVFDKFYPKWQPGFLRNNSHTGSAFVLKNRGSGSPTHQFHFRFPFADEDFEDLGVAPHEIDLRNYSQPPGISFEYTGDDVLRKLYYYIDRPEEKKIIARQFDEPWCEHADMLEYTQTDRARKVILWIYDVQSCQAYFDQLGWPILDELILTFREFGLYPMFPGIYEGGEIRAVYFFHFHWPIGMPFSEPANYRINTFSEIPWLKTS